jgi:hypothetical protein
VAGWGDDPVLEELRTLVDQGWEVVSVEEDVEAEDGPADRVVVRNGSDERAFVSDHLAFHRYVTGLQDGAF